MSSLWSQFVGGAYTSRSPTLADEACINLFPITLESQTNAKKTALLSTPGLKKVLGVATSSTRGMFSEDGRTWCVTGGTLYELDLVALTAISRGSIANDGLPVSFASNGRGGEQLAICGGGFDSTCVETDAAHSTAATSDETNMTELPPPHPSPPPGSADQSLSAIRGSRYDNERSYR